MLHETNIYSVQHEHRIKKTTKLSYLADAEPTTFRTAVRYFNHLVTADPHQTTQICT